MKYTDFGVLNEDSIEKIMAVFRSKKAGRETREFIASQLRGKSVEVAAGILSGLREVGKPLGMFLSQTAADLLHLPLSEFQALLAGSGAKKRGRPAKVRAEKTAKPAKRVKRALKLSPKRAAQLKIQGRYIGLMRSASEKVKAAAKKAAAAKGLAAGIAVLVASRTPVKKPAASAKKSTSKKPAVKKSTSKKSTSPVKNQPAQQA